MNDQRGSTVSLVIHRENRKGDPAVPNAEADAQKGPKYEVNLDGDVRDWPKSTISVPEIRALAGWGDDQPVVIVDMKTNEERDLREDEVVDLKPGQGFSKKIKFKRGSK